MVLSRDLFNRPAGTELFSSSSQALGAWHLGYAPDEEGKAGRLTYSRQAVTACTLGPRPSLQALPARLLSCGPSGTNTLDRRGFT